jgi:hypothetical protein
MSYRKTNAIHVSLRFSKHILQVTGSKQVNDRFGKEGKMKNILVILAVLVLTSTGTAGEYFKWVDERGVVHFTNVPSSVPEEYKDKAERRVMPSEKETPSGSTRESAVATEEPKDRFGRGRDFWVNWTNEARNRLIRAQNDYNRLLVEYKQTQADLDNAVSTAQRIEYRKKRDSLRVEMERRREDVRKAKEELEVKIPQAAATAGAPAEWVR